MSANTPPRPLVMTNQMASGGKAIFMNNYRDTNSNTTFYADLPVNWQAFAAQVQTMNSNHNIPQDRIALKFIHRFNSSTNRWYLTVQLCAITGSPLPDLDPFRRHETYMLDCKNTFCSIMDDGTIVDGPDQGLSGTVVAKYGTDYFNNVLYQSNLVVLNTNLHSVTFSWHSLQKLHDDNVTAARPDDSLFNLVLSSSSHEVTLPSVDSLVQYPHCVVAFMSYDGINCLDDTNIILGNFNNKAANYNTDCPNKCGIFLWHADLKRPTEQTN